MSKVLSTIKALSATCVLSAGMYLVALSIIFTAVLASVVLNGCDSGGDSKDIGADNNGNEDLIFIDSNEDTFKPDTTPIDIVGTDSNTPEEAQADIATDTAEPCVEIEVDEVKDCVSKEFADAVAAVPGTWEDIDTDEQIESEIHHFTSLSEEDQNLFKESCPLADYYITNFDPVKLICLESDLSLSLCKDNATPCSGHKVIGEIKKESDVYYVKYKQCNETVCDEDIVYKKL